MKFGIANRPKPNEPYGITRYWVELLDGLKLKVTYTLDDFGDFQNRRRTPIEKLQMAYLTARLWVNRISAWVSCKLGFHKWYQSQSVSYWRWSCYKCSRNKDGLVFITNGTLAVPNSMSPKEIEEAVASFQTEFYRPQHGVRIVSNQKG